MTWSNQTIISIS